MHVTRTEQHGISAALSCLERVLGENEIVTVIHLAAQTIVTIANRNPISTFETNIGGTWALLEACRRSQKVSQIVVASSDKAYGDQEKLPYDESCPLQGQHYDVSIQKNIARFPGCEAGKSVWWSSVPA